MKPMGFNIAIVLSVFMLYAHTVMGQTSPGGTVMTWTIGAWQIDFAPDASTLTCRNESAGASLSGKLAFSAKPEKDWEDWTIVPPRDIFPNRLALMDRQGNIQGYITFTGTGDLIRIAAAHRSAQTYPGELRFTPRAELGAETFACRTQVNPSGRVVQMACGPADSLLNDSLFDVARDTALCFSGEHVAIQCAANAEGSTPGFNITLVAEATQPAEGCLTIEVKRDYYRARYVPNYTPINRDRCPVAPTGWMSWNTYFDKATDEDNLAEARIGARELKPFGMAIWSIESWQDNSNTLPVQQFHNLTLRPSPAKFPHGMKWLADQIRALGFRPGIWTVPFGTGDKAFYEEHRDWFLHNPDGSPMTNWNGYYVIDPSQEAVRQHMEETHRIMSQEWGYEYFKIDGMSGRNAGYSAHFFERPEVRAAFKETCADPFDLCVAALRRGIGPDRIWLACQGHYTGPEIGAADAGRLGADIVAPNCPPDWNNYAHQAASTLNQLFVNNIVWYCDPDTLLVGEFASTELARLATTVVALPGQAMFAGDKLAQLPPARMRLLQQALPVCDVRPLDLFPIFALLPIWDLKISRSALHWDVVSLFNWDADPHDVSCRFDELGLEPDAEYRVYDFWNDALLGTFRESFTAANVPGHGNVLTAIHRAEDHPQFLSSDRHVTQGGTDLESVTWDAASRTLSGQTRLVEGRPTRLAIFAPDGFTAKSIETDGADHAELEEPAGNLLHIRLERATPGSATWKVLF